MRSLGARRIAVNMNSTFNLCHSPSPSGTSKDDKLISYAVPVHQTVKNDDLFVTQVVDYDDDVSTQPVDLNKKTQTMDLAGETQILDDYNDFGGGTQLLTVSDSETECESDGEGAGRTQVLDDTVHLNDIQIPDTSDNQTNDNEKINSSCRQDDGSSRAESLPSLDVTRRSDSLRKGFTSVRTASLRVAGLAARKSASKNAEKGSCSTIFNSGSSKCHFGNNGGIHTGRKGDMKNVMAKHDETGLGNGNRSDVARSLARKLFMEDDFEEGGYNKEPDLRMTEFSQLPDCDHNLAGLSYVDSQEPGELSQANALQFVDRFLKANLLEPDEDVIHETAVCEKVTPSSFKKGANSIARDANRRSSAASASVFEWNDKLEDEGGGEFFIKKRELLFGNRQGSHKSCDKSKTCKHFGAKISQCPERKTNEEQNVHDTTMGFRHSDSKLVRGRRVDKFDEIDKEKKDEDYTDELSNLAFLNVGIDTQMAAEAMEALSTATALVENSSSMDDKGPNNVGDTDERRETKYVPKQQNSAQKRAYTSNLRIVTRSQRKAGVEYNKDSVALRPSAQHLTKELKVDLVKPRVKRGRPTAKNTDSRGAENNFEGELCINQSVAVKRGRPSAEYTDGMGAENNLEGELHINQSAAVKRQSLRKKESTLITVQKNTQPIALNQLSCANATLNDSRKRKTRSDMPSGNPKAGVETVMLDGSSNKGKDLHQTCNKDTGNAKNSHTLTAYGACEGAFGSIARRTRSKRSSENASKLSLEKQAACSPPSKGTLADVSLGGPCSKLQGSSYPADVTPNNLKTPGNVVSPICMGNAYHTPSLKKNLFLKKECYKLIDSEDQCSSPFRLLRQRRDMNNVRVLFSQHMDGDIVKQQKKILSRLGFYEASSILEATHFVADTFTRTRNMVEAIANAKFVVTHQWLESCGQANCFIDEKNYILRDTKKEKELGFSMPMSLARASRHPLLEGRKVLLTPNIKPSKDVISSLVKAVHGQAIGRLCRSTSNNDKLLDDLFILSCEEDFDVCSPLLEKGISVYSSELLLNGIITQRLEYERHRLFVSHVKKTRSSLWLKKEGDQLLRVLKTN